MMHICLWTCRNKANMSDKIQVVIVDDHPPFRDGLIQTLKAELDIEIVGQTASAGEAEEPVAELVPDVVLLDITIPGRPPQQQRNRPRWLRISPGCTWRRPAPATRARQRLSERQVGIV